MGGEGRGCHPSQGSGAREPVVNDEDVILHRGSGGREKECRMWLSSFTAVPVQG